MVTSTSPTASDEFAVPTQSRLRELYGVRELPRLALNAARLKRVPRGSETIVAIPGFSTNDASTLPIRTWLSALGHTTFGWGFGTNQAKVESMLGDVTEMIERRCDAAGSPVALIGWSNGGVFAREVARDRPELVSRVFTYGTPIVGGPKYTRGAVLYDSDEIERIAAVVEQRNAIPIRVPITAFYSRNDAIVDWKACIDRFSPNVRNIQVRSTHASMGIDPDIWEMVARELVDTPR